MAIIISGNTSEIVSLLHMEKKKKKPLPNCFYFYFYFLNLPK